MDRGTLLARMDASIEALACVRARAHAGDVAGVESSLDDFLEAFRPVWACLELAAVDGEDEDVARRMRMLDALHRKAMRLMSDRIRRLGEDVRTLDTARAGLRRTAREAVRLKEA